MNEVLVDIQNFLVTTPVEVLGAYFLLFVFPVSVFGVLVWGFSELWIDRKQGQYIDSLKWDLLAIEIPQDTIQTPKGMENFFDNLMGSKSSITWNEKWLLGKTQAFFIFEIVSNEGHIQFYIRTTKKYRDLVEAALYAQYPEAQITEVEDYVDIAPDDFPNENYDMWGSEMVLSKENYFPLKTYEMFEHTGEKDLRFKDPILPMLEMMGKMKAGEHYWIQIIIRGPDEQDWAKEGTAYIEKVFGKEVPKPKGWFSESIGWIPGSIAEQLAGVEIGKEPEKKADDFRMFKITPEERERLDLVAKKISKLGWQAKVRFVYWAKHEVFRKGTIAAMTKGIFNQYAILGVNKLGLHNPSTPKDDYFYMLWQMPMKQRRLMQRYKYRKLTAGCLPYILNSEELASLFHMPSSGARTPVLTSLGARRAEPPVELGIVGGEPSSFLMNMDRTESDVISTQFNIKDEPLSVPTPLAPTTMPKDETIWEKPVEEKTDEPMPRPGMPAPLPPGLDLSADSTDTEGSPDDLPL
ncbi:hypothetical protein KJ758_01215 [Patescibacteria group bacterium]|nr:hypothetical protein [Patescibacteria group bacterium]